MLLDRALGEAERRRRPRRCSCPGRSRPGPRVSRGVRCSSGEVRARLRAATSTSTTLGSITDPPAATSRIASTELVGVRDALLEQVGAPFRAAVEERERVRRARRTARARRRRARGAWSRSCGRGLHALVAAGRRHADVGDHHVGRIGGDRVEQRRQIVDQRDRPRSRRRPRAAWRSPPGRAGSPRRRSTRMGTTGRLRRTSRSMGDRGHRGPGIPARIVDGGRGATQHAGARRRDGHRLGGCSVTLPREEVVPGTLAEFEAFEALVRSLDASELGVATRCSGWSAGDVAAHVIGQLADITAGNFDGLGTPEVTERQVAERRGRSSAELADEMADGPGDRGRDPRHLRRRGVGRAGPDRDGDARRRGRGAVVRRVAARGRHP